MKAKILRSDISTNRRNALRIQLANGSRLGSAEQYRNVSEAGLRGKYAKYEVDEVAAWLFTKHRSEELSSYLGGKLHLSRMDDLRSVLELVVRSLTT